MSFTFPKSKFQPDTRLIKPNGQNDPSEAAVALVTKTDDGWRIIEVFAGWSGKLSAGVTFQSLREIEVYVRNQLGMKEI